MRGVAILMSFLILFTSLKDLVTYVGFYANQDYIAQVFCINKDKPEILCSGKCFLNDSLIENHEEKKDTNTQLPQSEERIVFVWPLKVNIPETKRVLPSEKSPITYRHELYSFDFLAEVFHPPTFLS